MKDCKCEKTEMDLILDYRKEVYKNNGDMEFALDISIILISLSCLFFYENASNLFWLCIWSVLYSFYLSSVAHKQIGDWVSENCKLPRDNFKQVLGFFGYHLLNNWQKIEIIIISLAIYYTVFQ